MAAIPALLPPVHVERLRNATRGRHHVVVCGAWAAVAEACEKHHARIAVVDLFADGRANFEAVRQLRRQFPRLALVAYIRLGADRFRDVFDAGRQGVDALVIADRDDTAPELLAAISRAESRSLAELVRRSLGPVDPVVRDAVLVAVNYAEERLSPQRLARVLGLPRRTLALRLARLGFPPPRPLLTWGRLVVAAYLTEESHRVANRVAAALGFPSGSAFRNACRRYLHATPTEIRGRGGAQYVIRVLLRQVQESREPVRRRPGRRLALAV